MAVVCVWPGQNSEDRISHDMAHMMSALIAVFKTIILRLLRLEAFCMILFVLKSIQLDFIDLV